MNTKVNSGNKNPLLNKSARKGAGKISIKDRLIMERELSDIIINCVPGIFYLQDHTGKYIRWNKNFETVTGYNKEEIKKIHPLELFDKRDHEQMNAAIRKVYKVGFNEIEMELLTKDGQRPLFHLNGISVDYEGKLCLLGAGMDLTSRETAEHKIRENDKKYRSLFEQASDPILITDFNGNFKDVNGSCCKLFGYTKKELLKMNIKSLVCPFQLKQRPLRNDLLIKGKHLFSERLMIHKSGSIIETEANLKKFGEDSIMGIVRDVTEIRNMQREMENERMDQKEQEQKSMNRAVIRAQERERNNIGKELHDNVNQLLASARICLSTVKKTNTAKKDFIDQAIRMIDATILEIRTLGKKHVTPQKGFDLKEQIQNLARIMEEGIGFKISFEYDLPEQPDLQFDLKLNIYRIIQEQLNNVYKHASASRVQIKMYAGEEQIHIQINDDGIGFEVGLKKSGIGIVNITNRVESFNGKIEFKTYPGIGCKLDIRIPMIYQ